ncbi:MAG: hypothetical protein LBK22_00720, partial [Tannerella sp.]|nr:hypothetical protein [Tannerella sp.]
MVTLLFQNRSINDKRRRNQILSTTGRTPRQVIFGDAKLPGRSGIRIVSDAFGVNPKTIRKGRQELLDLPDAPSKRIRKEGGGAKKTSIASG